MLKVDLSGNSRTFPLKDFSMPTRVARYTCRSSQLSQAERMWFNHRHTGINSSVAVVQNGKDGVATGGALAEVAGRTIPQQDVSTKDMITDLKSGTALSWQQLARFFGVSSRSLHLWARGHRVSTKNLKLLIELHSCVAQWPAVWDNDQRRQAALHPEQEFFGIASRFAEQRRSNRAAAGSYRPFGFDVDRQVDD